MRRLERHDFAYKMLLVWDKGIPGMGDIDANWGCGHDLILYCKRGRREVAYRRSGIIAVDKLGSKQHVHPTEKPGGVVLMDEKVKGWLATIGIFVAGVAIALAIAWPKLTEDSGSKQLDVSYTPLSECDSGAGEHDSANTIA